MNQQRERKDLFMFKTNKYITTLINADEMLKDFGNDFLVVSVREYKGKPEKGLPSGASFTLQVLHDASPVEAGKENNLMEQFEVTVPGAKYPSDIKRGDHVRLGKFMPEASYYIKYSLILRFGEIQKIQPSTGGSNAKG